jgi:hypothetical protein
MTRGQHASEVKPKEREQEIKLTGSEDLVAELDAARAHGEAAQR